MNSKWRIWEKLIIAAWVVLLSMPVAGRMPSHEFELISDAKQLADAGDFATAEQNLRTLLERPDLSREGKPVALNMLAYVQYGQEDNAGALETYKTLLEVRGIGSELRTQTLYTAAQLSMVLKQYATSLRYLNDYFSWVPEPPATSYLLKAQILFWLERHADMIEPLTTAIRLTENAGREVKKDWWILMTAAYLEVGDGAGLADSYDVLMANWPSEELAKRAVVAFMKLRDAPRTASAMQRLLDRYPSDMYTSPIHVAVARSDSNEVGRLIDAGAALDKPLQIDRSPLQLAAEFGHTEVVELLVSRGAAVDLRNQAGDTALLLAAYGGHEEVVRMLWGAGADVRLVDRKYTPFQVLAREGKANLLEEWLGLFPDLLSAEGDLALFLAVSYGKTATTRLLIDRGASIHRTSEGGTTQLQLAAKDGNPELVALLLDAGADPNNYPQGKLSPLAVTATLGHEESFELLLAAEADPKVAMGDGRTALTHAAENGHPQIVKRLLSVGVDVDPVDAGGLTPLQLALGKQHYDSAPALVAAGADVTRLYSNGVSMLALVARAGELGLVAALLDAGADVSGGGTEEGRPLVWAVAEDQPDSVRMLVEAGAALNGTEDPSNNPLLTAVIAENESMVALLLELGAVSEGMLERLDGWTTKDVKAFLKKNKFERLQKGDIETWGPKDRDADRSVLIPKQKQAVGLVELVRLAKQTGIEISDWMFFNP